MSVSSMLAPPGTVLGNGYVVSRLIGEGGMGAVFAAEKAGERYAVKLLLGDQHNAGFVSRFLREAELSAALRGPNLVPVVDMGFDQLLQRLFLVMPLLQGRDLDQQLKHGPLHPTVAVRLIAQAAQGLVILHGGGVVHRDIKPANIFLDIRDGVVTAMVNDLGVAKVIEESSGGLTVTGAALGTPLFMAPEQLANAKQADARADVWSLGMSLYQALAGESPYARIFSFADLAVKLMHEEVPLLQDRAPWVDPTLAALVHATLIRSRDDRCPSASELLEALLPFVGGTTEVTEAMLAPAGDEVRSSAAPAAARPRSWATRPRPDVRSKVNDPRIGQLVGRKYKLRKLLGQGGMGAVYEADGPAGAAAVKVMTNQHAHDDAALRRFVREARAAMAVQSPHVVAVLDADTDPSQGAPYIAMELLRGEDLESLVNRVGPLEPRVAAQVFVEACEGLEAAHKKGLVHRDIKPANLFLHHEGDRVVVKVCDFGVAKAIGTPDGQPATVNLTRTGGMLGSPIYMSPEQAQNAKDVDARTDLWSLSASLYQVLTGRPPWQGLESLGEVIVAICTKDFTPIQQVAPWIDPLLADIVQRGVQRDREVRWGSAAEMKAALSAYANSARLTRDSLGGISPESKQRVAPLASLVFAQTEHALASTGSPPQARKTPLVAGVVGVAMVVGVGGLLATRPGATSAPPAMAASSTPSARPSASAAPVSIQARVTVTPRDARVAVGDRPTYLGPGGVLLLEGHPGEELEVTVEAGDQLVKRSIKLIEQGRAEPSSIDATPAPSASAKKPSPTTPAAARGPRPPADPAATPAAPPPPADKPPVALPPRF